MKPSPPTLQQLYQAAQRAGGMSSAQAHRLFIRAPKDSLAGRLAHMAETGRLTRQRVRGEWVYFADPKVSFNAIEAALLAKSKNRIAKANERINGKLDAASVPVHVEWREIDGRKVKVTVAQMREDTRLRPDERKHWGCLGIGKYYDYDTAIARATALPPNQSKRI